jgi:hypothetical protein
VDSLEPAPRSDAPESHALQFVARDARLICTLAIDFINLSERKLMDCLNRLGYDIEIRVKPGADPVGHLMIAIA